MTSSLGSSASAMVDICPVELAASRRSPPRDRGAGATGTASTVSPDLGSYDDDNIEFDFFDEPETVEAAQRGRRRPRRGGGGRRPPLRTPTGLVPLARLVGLIALAIAVVVGLVFWVGACQGKSKHDEYASYAAKVQTLAHTSSLLGQQLASELAAATKQNELVAKLQQYAAQEQQAYDQAVQIRPPGPLRLIHQGVVDALALRVKGLAGMGTALSARLTSANATATSDALAAQAQLLTASDVVWDQIYRVPATQQLKQIGVTGVVIPRSHFVANPEILSSRSFGVVLQHLGGASTGGGGGTATGKHGDGIVSVRALPQGTDLSTSSASTIKVTPGLSFVATVEDSGDFPETSVPVTLTIDFGSGKPIVQRKVIQVIQPAQQTTVTFTGFQLPNAAFGANARLKVFVAPVNGEINTANNTATYTVFFTLS